MITIPSVTFGEIEIDEAKIYTFDGGIPGLRNISRYAIIESEELAPFKWLQACESPYLSLMTLDPNLIDPNYKVTLHEEHYKHLDSREDKDVFLLSIIVVPEDPQQMTANMLAPLVLNHATRKGLQVVIDGNKNLLRVKVIQD